MDGAPGQMGWGRRCQGSGLRAGEGYLLRSCFPPEVRGAGRDDAAPDVQVVGPLLTTMLEQV